MTGCRGLGLDNCHFSLWQVIKDEANALIYLLALAPLACHAAVE